MTKFVLILIGVALMLISFMIVLFDLMTHNPRIHRVDCSLVSFHPDYTPAVRKACRKTTT